MLPDVQRVLLERTVYVSLLTPPPQVISGLSVHMLGSRTLIGVSGNISAPSDHTLPAATESIFSAPAWKGQISGTKIHGNNEHHLYPSCFHK